MPYLIQNPSNFLGTQVPFPKLHIAAPSGSEKSITPKNQWISTRSGWTDEDNSNPPATAASKRERTPVFQSRDIDDDLDAEAEESEEESEDFDGWSSGALAWLFPFLVSWC